MRSKKILLIDDPELIAALSRDLFRRRNLTLMLTSSLAETLQLAAEQSPDLIILPHSRPDFDGLECCRRLKQAPRLTDIPVLLLLPAGNEAVKTAARQVGANALIEQPINRRTLLNATSDLLTLRERQGPREETRLPVLYGEDPSALLLGFSHTLGPGGLLLQTNTPLPEGTRLQVEFILPTELYNVRCSSEVVWVNRPLDLPAQMGLQFLNLSSSDSAALQRYLGRPSGSN